MSTRNPDPPAEPRGSGVPPKRSLLSTLRGFLSSFVPGKTVPVPPPKRTVPERVAPPKTVSLQKLTVAPPPHRVQKRSAPKRAPAQPRIRDEEEADLLPVMQRSLEEYMSRRAAYRAVTKKFETSAPAGKPVAVRAHEVEEPGGWRRFLRFLPFLSETVMRTEQKADALGRTLRANQQQTKDMARRLHEAEMELAERTGGQKTAKQKTVPPPAPVEPGNTGRLLSMKEPVHASTAYTEVPTEPFASSAIQLSPILPDTPRTGAAIVSEAKSAEKPRQEVTNPNQSPSAGTQELPKQSLGLLGSFMTGLHELKSDWNEAAEETAAGAALVHNKPPSSVVSLRVVTGPAATPVAGAPAPVEAEAQGKLLGPVERQPSAPRLGDAAAAPLPEAPRMMVVDGEDKGSGVLSSLLSSLKGSQTSSPLPQESPNATTAKVVEEIVVVPKQKDQTKEKKPVELPPITTPKKKEKIAPADIPVIKVVKRKSEGGAFAEFMGSIKYFGMGKERLSIIQNLATMLNAGLPLIDAIKTLQMEVKVKPAKKLLGRIIDSVENGNALWRAMQEQHFFSPHAIALIRIGEEAGNLAQNMQYLAAQQEKDQNLHGKIRMAMIYPSIVLSLVFVIVIGLGMFVLPNLIQVLFSLNAKLPLVTRLVIAFTNLFTTYGAVAIPAFLAIVVLLIILGKFTRLKVLFQWILFQIPGVGRLTREATLARFGVILGSLLQAGVPLVESLRSLAEVTSIIAYRRFYYRLLEHINLGDSFAKSFSLIRGSARLVPISVQQLIITGERTGSLAPIMLKIADIYEKEANDTAQKLPVILEPILTLFMGALVGTIAFAIIVPIYSIVGNVGK